MFIFHEEPVIKAISRVNDERQSTARRGARPGTNGARARTSTKSGPASRRILTATGCTAALLAGVTACGTVENVTAGQRVDNAVDRLGEQRSLAFELSLDADRAAVDDLLASAAKDSAPGEGPPPEFGTFLREGRITVSVQSKKPLATSDEKDLVGASMAISGADGTLAEYRVVGETYYYRADMAAFGELVGAPMPSADELPPEAGALRDVLEGKWVKVDRADLERAGAEQEPSLDAKAQKKLLKTVRGVIAREVTFKDKGGKDGVDHIAASAKARPLLTGLFDELEQLSGELPPGTDLPTADDLKSVPNKRVSMDFGIKNGALHAVTFDLAQLADASAGLKKGTKLPLMLQFRTGHKVTAPAGATKIDPDALTGLAPMGPNGANG